MLQIQGRQPCMSTSICRCRTVRHAPAQAWRYAAVSVQIIVRQHKAVDMLYTQRTQARTSSSFGGKIHMQHTQSCMTCSLQITPYAAQSGMHEFKLAGMPHTRHQQACMSSSQDLVKDVLVHRQVGMPKMQHRQVRMSIHSDCLPPKLLHCKATESPESNEAT